ncbi:MULTISPECIES: EamA family transporter [Bacillaceae]|uniref:EamA family transporter n=1 Tax=Evansella alkalicola TaxID=745819 RepID=A0ABS6JXK6_9BACI|nr:MULTISPECIES: EamA family transporter [Bacillaceae]MBU9723320.1 EamA family transporter [Bacillus alkalicola]
MSTWFLLAVASAIVFGFSTFFFKINSFKDWPLLPFFVGVYGSGTLAFVVTAYWEGVLFLTTAVILSGVVVGIGSTFGNLLFMKALEHGPVSLTSPIVNTNILLIVLMSVFLYGERLGVFEYTGILLIIAAITILPLDPKEKLSIPNRIWYVYALAATVLFFLRNGGLKVTEEMALPNTTILMVGYFVGTVWSIYAYILDRGKKKVPQSKQVKAVVFGLITGLFSYGGMQLYAVALQTGPASIISPIFATNSLVVALLSILYLKEKLTGLQVATLVCVFVGIVLLRVG